jgi:predicted ArsR family transcriptional regulator
MIAKGALERQRWAQRMFGNTPIAAALLYAYLRDEDFLNADQIAELAEVSPDTVRRVLKPLVATNRVECRKENRVTTYRVHPAWAQQGIDALLTIPKV